MIIVDITCHERWYPIDGPTPALKAQSQEQLWSLELARALPDMLIKEQGRIGLESDTPGKSTVVNLAKFHFHAVNAPNLAIQVIFTAKLNRTAEQNRAKTLIKLLNYWFAEREIKLGWKLDVLPSGLGCYTNADGVITKTW